MSRRRREDQVSVFGRGRVCAAADCATILSAYNPSAHCGVHEPPEVSRKPGPGCTGRPLETRLCGNPLCGRAFESRHAKRQYCSDRCRMQAFQERRLVSQAVVSQTSSVAGVPVQVRCAPHAGYSALPD